MAICNWLLLIIDVDEDTYEQVILVLLLFNCNTVQLVTVIILHSHDLGLSSQYVGCKESNWLQAVINKAIRYGYIPPSFSTQDELNEDADKKLFFLSR